MFTKRHYLAAALAAVLTTVLTIWAQAADHSSLARGAENKAAPQEPRSTGVLDILRRADEALEGTWVVTVNLATPPPGFAPSFTAFETYSRGGGMVTSNNLPPVPRPGQGAWRRNGSQYEVSIRFFLFDPSGAQVGSVKVLHRITLEGSDRYSGVGQAQFFDLNGNALATIPFTTQGRRLVPESW